MQYNITTTPYNTEYDPPSHDLNPISSVTTRNTPVWGSDSLSGFLFGREREELAFTCYVCDCEMGIQCVRLRIIIIIRIVLSMTYILMYFPC